MSAERVVQERARAPAGGCCRGSRGRRRDAGKGRNPAPADAAAPAPDVVEDVAGDAEGEEVDRRPADDLISAEMDGEEGVDEREQRAGEDADGQAADPAVGLVRAPGAEEGAHQHHPLEADVHHAAALGEHPAERGEEQRRREDERQRDERRPRDDGGEVVGVRPRDEDAADHADQAAGDRPPARPARAVADRPGAERHSGAADEQRGGDRAHDDRRQHEPEREHAHEDPDPGDADRLEQRPRGDLGVGAQIGLPLRVGSRSFLPLVHR